MADVTVRSSFGKNWQIQVSHDSKETVEFRLIVLNECGEEIVVCTTNDWEEIDALSDALNSAIRNYCRSRSNDVEELLDE